MSFHTNFSAGRQRGTPHSLSLCGARPEYFIAQHFFVWSTLLILACSSDYYSFPIYVLSLCLKYLPVSRLLPALFSFLSLRCARSRRDAWLSCLLLPSPSSHAPGWERRRRLDRGMRPAWSAPQASPHRLHMEREMGGRGGGGGGRGEEREREGRSCLL